MIDGGKSQMGGRELEAGISDQGSGIGEQEYGQCLTRKARMGYDGRHAHTSDFTRTSDHPA
jgi:hypothetical protein